MTHVGYRLTPTALQTSGFAPSPLGSHSTYGRKSADGPNRAFCSLHAGHQYAPYMTAPVDARCRASAAW